MYRLQVDEIVIELTIEQFIQINKQLQLMKRPQSAKPGYRAPAMQSSADEIRQQDIFNKNAHHRKQVKLLKPDLTQNDFARIMPKKIYQDKERLYSEGLQLKQKLNQIQQENIRLKTRISILEKQKDKLGKAIDVAADSANKSQSRFKMYQGPSKQQNADNTRVRNLTKIIRESKQENQYLRQQNAKIKKAVKFTKINQVEIQCKILREEYQKLQQLLVQMNDKLADQDEYQKQISQLKNYLQQQVQSNKQLSQSNQKYVEYIQELENKLNKQTQKNQQKQKKLQRQLALNKRKLNESIKMSDDLRKQLRVLKQAPQNVAKPKQIPSRNITRPMSSTPYTNKEQNKQPINNDTLAKLEQMKQKNQKLEKQLKQIKQKLEKKQDQKSEPENKKQKQKQQNQKQHRNNEKELGVDSGPEQDYSKQNFDQEFILSPQKIKTESKTNEKQKGAGNFILKQESKSSNQKNNNDFILKQEKKADLQNQYLDQFQQQEKQDPKKNPKKPSPKKPDAHLQNYNKDFQQQDGQQQELYKKEPKKGKEKEKQKQKQKQKQKGKKKKIEQSKKGYEPNKQILTQIKQLLTYRMKAQRYPFEQLQKDILGSNQSNFSYNDLEGMITNEPFYLTPSYTKQFLQYVFEKKQIGERDEIPTQVLLQKLRKVIKTFQLLDEQQQQNRLMSIAEMTTQYPNQLENAFQKIKNGPDTVSKKNLVQMFKKLELADHFIEIIIAQLSLCSTDLQHLSIRGYFQRFYIDDMENENAINEQQIESSGEQKPNPKGNIQKIDQQEEYSDDKVNFIMEDEAELSMRGGKGKQQKLPDYNEEMVSDDGHI